MQLGSHVVTDENRDPRGPGILPVLTIRATRAGSGYSSIGLNQTARGSSHHFNRGRGDHRTARHHEKTVFDLARVCHHSAREPVPRTGRGRELAGDLTACERLRDGEANGLLIAQLGNTAGYLRSVLLVFLVAGHVRTLLAYKGNCPDTKL